MLWNLTRSTDVENKSDHMSYRTFFWCCILSCLCCRYATAQDSSPQTSAAQTLQELKVTAAQRSKYRQPPRQAVDSVAVAEVPAANLAEFQKIVQPILHQACVQCHGPDTQEGNIRIDTLDPDLLHGDDVDWWLEVMAVLSNGEMPPPESDELPDEDRRRVVDWLSHEVQIASTVRRATAGHSSFRRLTRYEYNYAMQDILGLPWDFAKDLPPEAHSDDGFQNSSEMLHMSVMQFETYRQLARTALLKAIVQGERPAVIRWGVTMQAAADREWPKQSAQLEKLKEQFKDDAAKQQQEVDKLTASFNEPHSRPYYLERSTGRTARAEWSYGGAKYAFGSTDTPFQFPDAVDHVAVIPAGRNQRLTVELGDQIPEKGIMRVRVRASKASDEDHRIPSLQLEFGFQASNEGQADSKVSSQDTPIDAASDSPKIYEWDVPLGEIYPRNDFRGLSKMGALPSPSEYIRFVNSSVPQGGHGDILIDSVEVMAPVYDQWPPESHTRIFFDSPQKDNETQYAAEVLARFMSRAWRRSPSQAEVDAKIELFAAMRPECIDFEEAMIEVLATVLSSPSFLYVVTEDHAAETRSETTAGDDADANANANANGPQRLSDYELATRLSLFLWCSVPDDQLLGLAASQQLSNADILSAQVKRMLADPRSQRFSEHFVQQWLDMQLLDFLSIDKSVMAFESSLKAAMQHEPVALFQQVLNNNESVLNFIHTDYTMSNERLALHYGLPAVRGNHFRPVKLDETQRGGLLTQAGLLAMNSDGKDSHPLKRGVWLLKILLNDPPPPPPPAVPEIDLADPEIAKLTLKQRIEDHRNHAACMSCHAKIDPWGIAFENYDAAGRWRNQIHGQPVDAASLLFNYQELSGIDGLKRFLLENRQDQFVRAIVHKISTYALGRMLTFDDHASIDNITAQVRQQSDGLETIILLLVNSELFQSR